MTSANPASAKTSCPPPAIHRRHMSEPRPGVASWLTSAAFLALARLSGRPFGENSFISEHCRCDTNGDREQDTDTTGKYACHTHQANNNPKPKNLKPMLVNHLPTRLHRQPKWHLLVHDERQRELKTNGEINHRDRTNQQHRQRTK